MADRRHTVTQLDFFIRQVTLFADEIRNAVGQKLDVLGFKTTGRDLGEQMALPQLRGRLARLPFGCNGIMGIFTPARFSACRPHCVNYDWTEVSLRPHLSLRSTPPRGVYQRLNRSCPVAVMARTLSALPYS